MLLKINCTRKRYSHHPQVLERSTSTLKLLFRLQQDVAKLTRKVADITICFTVISVSSCHILYGKLNDT